MVEHYNKNELLIEDRVMVNVHKLLLVICRGKRFVKRNSKLAHKYSPISIICCLIILIQVYVGVAIEQYGGICEGLWDTKSFIITSILLPIVTVVLNSEYVRHTTLIEQRNLIDSFSSSTYKFYGEFNIERDEIERLKRVLVYKEQVNNTLRYLQSKELVGYRETAVSCAQELFEALVKIELRVNSEESFEGEIYEIASTIDEKTKNFIEELNYPWRLDIHRDAKINAITEKYREL